MSRLTASQIEVARTALCKHYPRFKRSAKPSVKTLRLRRKPLMHLITFVLEDKGGKLSPREGYVVVDAKGKPLTIGVSR